MPSLENFLGKGKLENSSGEVVSGSFACQECSELVTSGKLNYEEKVLIWVCSLNHISKVGMDV